MLLHRQYRRRAGVAVQSGLFAAARRAGMLTIAVGALAAVGSLGGVVPATAATTPTTTVPSTTTPIKPGSQPGNGSGNGGGDRASADR